MLDLKETLRKGLADAGISAGNAREWSLGKLVEERGLYISLRQVTAAQGALYHYLGVNSDGDELYGMTMDVIFALVLLSPKSSGGYGAEEFAEETINALMAVPEAMGAREIVCGEAEYDSLRDCFRQEIVVSNRVMAYGTQTDVGTKLEDFHIEASVR